VSRLNESEFPGIQIFDRAVFKSDIGSFSNLYTSTLVNDSFTQDSISFAANKGTVRGLHFQSPPYSQSKLINVVQGAIEDFFLDLRPHSSSFLSYGKVILDQSEPKTLYIPRGFAHGFITLQSNTIVSYKLDNEYNSLKENTIIWNDPMVGIEWPLMNQYFHSSKDLSGKPLSEIIKNNLHI
jgi:dTDP-4-dehydrorhamnose 3,5-epimerase